MIYHIAETTSTNDLAREERYGHGDVICAERQTAGRGQRGHTWTSPEGVNLLFSVVLCPTFLPAGEQFLLSQAVALALVDTLGTCGIDARIKWTNDIYAGDRKLVGILIEHHLAGGRLARTVAGIGINVNQTEFDPALPNPTSMALEAGRTFDREEVLDRFHAALMRRYAALEAGDRAPLAEEYRRRMYRIDAPQGTSVGIGRRFSLSGHKRLRCFARPLRALEPPSDLIPPPVQCGICGALRATMIICWSPVLTGLRPAGSHCESSG